MTKTQTDYTFSEATFVHAEQLGVRMRKLDAEEVRASGDLSPQEALRVSIQRSAEAWTALYKGEPFAMFGVSPFNPLSTHAVPWLLTREDIFKHRRELIKYSRKVAHHWLDRWPILINYMDAEHEPGLRWAKWVGFEIFPAEPYGPFGKPFHRIELRKK